MLPGHHALAALATAVASTGQLAEEQDVHIGSFITLRLKQSPHASQVMPSSSSTTAATARHAVSVASTPALSDWLIDEDNAQAAAGIQWPHTSTDTTGTSQQQGSSIPGTVVCSPEYQIGGGQAHLQHVGCVVWQSGVLLAELLLSHPPLGPWGPHVKVLDLGSGTGVTGIALAKAGAAVCLTDRPHILPLARANVAANCPEGCDVLVQEYCWGADASQLLHQMAGPPDIITAADVLYDNTQHVLLLDALRKCSAPHTIIYIAYRRRSSIEDRFAAAAEAAGYTVQTAPDSLLPEEYQGHTYSVLCLTSRDEGVAQAGLVPAVQQCQGGDREEAAEHIRNSVGRDGSSSGAWFEEQPEHRPCRQQ